jgi:RNA polymerase sigma factor (sigma-70 family)
MSSARATGDRLTDEALLAGLAVGDPDVAVVFVRRFQRRVFGLALTMVSDPALAEDVAQEALVKVWRHAGAFDPRRGSVTTWVLAITRNLAIDALRVRRAAPADPTALNALLPADGGQLPDEQATASDAAARLRAAIATLPPEQRRALLLASFAGRTAQEIADSEGIPVGTAKTRIRAAMHKLRTAVVDERRHP